jgi:hypothetical protein
MTYDGVSSIIASDSLICEAMCEAQYASGGARSGTGSTGREGATGMVRQGTRPDKDGRTARTQEVSRTRPHKSEKGN